MALTDRLARVRQRIDDACRAAGRAEGSVRLLPVSKTQPVAVIREAVAAGLRGFGENRVQEAKAKAAELADLGLRWSIIGHLQTNKVRDVATFADELQSLDSPQLAVALDRRLQTCGRGLDVYLQVNTSGEATKSGVPPSEVLPLARGLAACTALRPVGLMTIATNTTDPAVVRDCFRRLVAVREIVRADDRSPAGFDELSMGMSGDLELAIAEGATVVRVGQGLFGPRAKTSA